jgi:hypothetical protein
MSDAIEKTAAGATRTLFGALGFILLMVGIEGMIPSQVIGLVSGAVLALIGIGFFFLAAVWNGVRPYITAEGERKFGAIARSRIVWAVLATVFFEAVLFLPFIEQRRWPFIHDPYVIHIPLNIDSIEPSLPEAASKETIRVLNSDVTNILSIMNGAGVSIGDDWRKILADQMKLHECNLNSVGLTALFEETSDAQKSLMLIGKADPLNVVYLSIFLTDQSPGNLYSFNDAAEIVKQFEDQLQKAGSVPCDTLGKNWQLLRAYVAFNGGYIVYAKWLSLVRVRMLKLQSEIRNAL